MKLCKYLNIQNNTIYYWQLYLIKAWKHGCEEHTLILKQLILGREESKYVRVINRYSFGAKTLKDLFSEETLFHIS